MKKKFHFLLTLPILITLGSTLVVLLLPYLSDIYLFPRLLKELPFTNKELSLSRISPWKTRGTLTLADADRLILSLPKFELHYMPGDLIRGKITEILLDSASIQVDMQDGSPTLRGLPSPHAPNTKKDKASPFLLPLAVETIRLKNCTITLHREPDFPINIIVDGRFCLDFLEQTDNKKLLSGLSGQIKTRGDLAVSAAIELKPGKIEHQAQLQLQTADIRQLRTLFPSQEDVHLTGGLLLNSQIHFAHEINRITGYDVTVKLPGLQFRKNDFVFENTSADKPVTLQLSGNLDKAQYELANVILTTPDKITLDMKGEIASIPGTFTGVGRLFSTVTNSAATLHFTGDRQQARTNIHYTLAGDAFTLGDTIACSSIQADGEIHLDGPIVTGTLNSRIPKLSLKKDDLSLENLSLQLPFQYPLQRQEESTGKLTIEAIRYQSTNSGKLQATFSPTPQGATFTSTYTTPFVPGLKLTCEGSTQSAEELAVHCRFPETLINSATLPSFLPLPDKLTFTGKLAAAGEFYFKDKIPTGKLTVDYHDGTLSQGEKKLSAINVGVVFPHLPLLASRPGELCTIGSLNFGKIKLSDARIHFRIEGQQSIFIEKIRANWCGGKVETGGFSLAGDMKQLETTLYCDRLGFTELLSQFGIDQTEGQGSLNGRLPMIINRQGMAFDDGFLFSTPGNSGIVRFNDTKQLRQGIPDIGRSASLDYSMKALENFSYNWTKLTFNSQQNDLLIAMQLDGKPADPLPFGYKDGQIIPSVQGPGLQHPIRLDVNFRLPMQDLFRYGKNIQSIMENM